MANQKESFDQAIERVHAAVNKHISGGAIDDLDNMTVKELKLKVLGETEKVVSNDEKASVISVVVLVIFT